VGMVLAFGVGTAGGAGQAADFPPPASGARHARDTARDGLEAGRVEGGAVQLFDLVAARMDVFMASLAQPQQVLAVVSAAAAGVLVMISAFVKTMIPLRWLAVASNVGFIFYGLLHPALLMVLLHSVLLPVNLWRVQQMVRLTRRVSASAVDAHQLEVWLRPYMRARRRRAGSILFKRGDLADRLYFLVDGQLELPEVGRTLEAGQMFGEIAFFAHDRRRSSTARCLTDCTVLSIDEDTFRQLIYQNPDFGLEVMRLIASRLSDDVQRLRPSPDAGS